MTLRSRKANIDLENGLEYNPKTDDFAYTISDLKQQLDISRTREKNLTKTLRDLKIKYADQESEDSIDELESPKIFLKAIMDRSGWLIGLLIFQSFSSLILKNNEEILQSHPSIVFYLTMLVGAGGNAGNQATIKAIRELALGILTEKNMLYFILRELTMSLALSLILGIFGFLRVYIFSGVPFSESLAICCALIIIVLFSVLCGATLPIIFYFLKIDPAHSSTTIQVLMDIAGVLITCSVATILLQNNPSILPNTL